MNPLAELLRLLVLSWFSAATVAVLMIRWNERRDRP
jgi:hypothetical protein